MLALKGHSSASDKYNDNRYKSSRIMTLYFFIIHLNLVSTRVYVCLSVCVCVYVCVHVYVFVCVHACTCE